MTTYIRQHKLRFIVAAVVLALAASLGISQAARAASAGAPQFQTGTVHSYTTGGNAGVSTSDGGLNWCFNGNCQPPPGGGSGPLHQTGTVHSYTTNGNAGVTTNNGGYDWQFNG